MGPLHVGDAFAAEGFDAFDFQFQVKQEPVGAVSVAEGLYRIEFGRGEQARPRWQGQPFAVPLKHREVARKRAEHGVGVCFDNARDRDRPDFQSGAGTHLSSQGLGHELRAQARADHRNARVDRASNEQQFFFNPGIGIIHGHGAAHDQEEIRKRARKIPFRDQQGIKLIVTVLQRLPKRARAFKGNVLEAQGLLHGDDGLRGSVAVITSGNTRFSRSRIPPGTNIGRDSFFPVS